MESPDPVQSARGLAQHVSADVDGRSPSNLCSSASREVLKWRCRDDGEVAISGPDIFGLLLFERVM